ncbi:class I SAM-dependent DNA methyltransferase [Proteus terrae]|uniref:class I SAM-dependent DNA methyltransferase n=1 Tax=Proteus terrae TaxID=1574161 RepID=UPI001CBECB82|nr:DNA methyltransferase [Proteus terrae]UAX02108.1 class I SAM-dependent DNA methyltransferase [Proteus terrae subsp. cibarius]
MDKTEIAYNAEKSWPTAIVTSSECYGWCGSGNFLIVSYKELRKLEMRVIEALNQLEPESFSLSGLHLSQFYGIEIDDFACEIARLSLWLAEHQLNTQWEAAFGSAPAALPLRESGNIYSENSLRLDWEQICPKERGDEIYIIGNPPFLGTLGRSDEQKLDMQSVFNGFRALGYLDYVACWFWKGAQYIQNSCAELAFVATNSLCQGEQIATLWPPIFKIGLNIHFAYPTFTWSNNARDKAAVHVVIIGMSSNNKIRKLFHYYNSEWHSELVDNISPYLLEGSNTVVIPRNKPIVNNIPPLLFGNKPTDGGHLLLNRSERDLLIEKEPNAKYWLKKVLGATEFLNGKERWCLWLVDAKPEDLAAMPLVKKRLQAIKKLRLKAGHPSALKMAEQPHLFIQVSQPISGNYILIPRVSSERRTYIPIGFFDYTTICSDANMFIPNGTLYEFGILTSLMHNDWMRLVAGRLKSDYRYSSSVVYNTFPWPDVTDSQRERIEQLAEDVILTREEFPGRTLAELYDPNKMPEKLLAAHHTLDRAVDKLYRDRPFKDATERLSCLLARYEALTKNDK